VQKNPVPQLLLDGHLVLSSQLKKQCWHIKDIIRGWRNFPFFPSFLFIIFLTARRIWCSANFRSLYLLPPFSWRVWLAHDQSFCKHADATHLPDCSTIIVAGSSISWASRIVFSHHWAYHGSVCVLPLCTSLQCMSRLPPCNFVYHLALQGWQCWFQTLWPFPKGLWVIFTDIWL